MATKPQPEFQNSSWTGQERRTVPPHVPPQSGFELVLYRLESMEKSQEAANGSIAKMAEGISRLAVIEERNNNLSEAVGRAFEDIKTLADAVEKRLVDLEKVAPLNNQARVWVFAVVIGVATAALMFVGLHTGLIQK